MKYLPKGKEYAEGRQLIYDEKSIFLNNIESSGVEKFQIAVSKSANNRLPYFSLTGKDKDPLYRLNPNDLSIPVGKDK